MSALDVETTAQRVEYVCPRCGGVVAPDDTVCPHCGQLLDATAEEKPRPTPEPPAVRKVRPPEADARQGVTASDSAHDAAVLSLLMVPAWLGYIAIYVWMTVAWRDMPWAVFFLGFFGIFVPPIVGIVFGRRAVRLGKTGLGNAGIVANILAIVAVPAFLIFAIIYLTVTGFDPG